MAAPLLVTCDPDLLDDLLRLSAAAGVTLDIAHDATSALRSWASAALVLVGPDLAGALVDQSPPRRPDVLLLSSGDPDYRTAVRIGAADVVSLPGGEPWLVEALADVADGGRRAAVTVGFLGGSGGVGATTLACATALLAARRGKAVLVDLDPLGPGVEQVVGLDAGAGVTWTDLAGSRGRLGSRALRDSLPHKDGLAVLGWGADAETSTDDTVVPEVVAAAQRGNDLVVVDLPRQLSASAAAVVPRCDHLVLVAACTLPGAAAAMRSLSRVAALTSSARLVARTGGEAGASALGTALGLPLLTTVGHQRRLPEQLDLGLGPLHARRGPVARAAADVLAAVAR